MFLSRLHNYFTISVLENRKKPATRSSFLSSFRGKLKNLTRSDLEELIVQKLCEVITERSATGELRRKAQALEMEIERYFHFEIFFSNTNA